MQRTLKITLPAGLFCLAACSHSGPPIHPATEAVQVSSGADWTQEETISITLSEYAFSPDQLRLSGGRPYRFHLQNKGTSRHTFTAPEFFTAVAVREGAVADEALTSGGTITVPAGGTKDIELVPLNPGTYEMVCDVPMHSLFGMTGQIVIQPAPAPAAAGS